MNHARDLHEELVLFPPNTREVQFDEKWAFVAKKEKNCDEADPADDRKGDTWDHVALDAESRLVVSVVPGERTAENVAEVVADFRRRTGGRLMDLITTDGYPAYRDAILAAYGETITPPGPASRAAPRPPTRSRPNLPGSEFLRTPSRSWMPATLERPALAPLPFEPYRHEAIADLDARILAARISPAELGDSLLILGHHYQQDEVIRFADLRGDSYKLAKMAADSRECRWIVFCGVHFMAETADILTRPEVDVILPDLAAGCSMADMADLDAVEAAWADLGEVIDTSDLMPVTYINSAADLKAFCGRNGGIVCTSSNARAVLEWSFARRKRVLFFPDQHLGRNTARAMGIPLDQMPVWAPTEPMGGHSEAEWQASRVILWRGHCSVHQMFRPAHVDQFRERFPGVRVLVHPECQMAVVDKADLVGSTEFILKTVGDAEPGSIWAVGTELHLVNRLAAENLDKNVMFLSPMVCMCATMYRIDVPHLCWTLENIVRGTPTNIVKVPDETAKWAKVALERMLDVS